MSYSYQHHKINQKSQINITMICVNKSIALVHYISVLVPHITIENHGMITGQCIVNHYDPQHEDFPFMFPLWSCRPEVFTSKSSFVVKSLQKTSKTPLFPRITIPSNSDTIYQMEFSGFLLLKFSRGSSTAVNSFAGVIVGVV